MNHDRSTQAFLSVIAWPEGADRRDAVAILDRAFRESGASRTPSIEDIRLRSVLKPPMILGFIDKPGAQAACDAIRDSGGEAFAPTLAELTALGPTLKIRHLELAHGNLDVTIWRGPQTTIKCESILCLVRAHLSGTVVVRTPSRARLPQHYHLQHMPPSMRSEFTKDASTKKLQTSDKLDIHTVDGSVFQLDGDKFAYLVLGDLRGHSDRQNMDKMFELLQHIAEHAIPDMYYSLWKAPPSFEQLTIPHANINADDPAFGFYSRWCALMYRHLLENPSPQ